MSSEQLAPHDPMPGTDVEKVIHELDPNARYLLVVKTASQSQEGMAKLKARFLEEGLHVVVMCSRDGVDLFEMKAGENDAGTS